MILPPAATTHPDKRQIYRRQNRNQAREVPLKYKEDLGTCKNFYSQRKLKNQHQGLLYRRFRHWLAIVIKTDLERGQWHPIPVLLPGKSHGRRSLEGCSPWGRWGSDMTELLHFHFSLSCIGEGNGNPLQCSCLENPRDDGAWWAAVYGIAQSRTRLKRLSSSSCSSIVFFTCDHNYCDHRLPILPSPSKLLLLSLWASISPLLLSWKQFPLLTPFITVAVITNKSITSWPLISPFLLLP